MGNVVCSVILVLELVGQSATVLWSLAFRKPISGEDRITDVISKQFVLCFSLESFKFGCVNMKCYHKTLLQCLFCIIITVVLSIGIPNSALIEA